MGNTLQGNTVLLFGGQKDIAPHPVVMLGIDSAGQAQPLAVAAGGAPTLPTGAATAANQATQITAEQAILAKLPGAVTASPHNLAASTALVIPAGSKGWTVTCLTGTISIACGTTASALPAGLSDGDPNITAADITVTTASTSTAYVRYNT